MGKALEKRRLLRMNQDDELRILKDGECRYFLNCRVSSSDNDNQYAIENTKGNTLIQFTLPQGTNKTIGAYEDKKRNMIYWFNYNSQTNHHILQYDVAGNVVTKVLQKGFLNFDVNHLITGVNIVELKSGSNLLYWTDDFNEPAKINIQKAIAHTQGNFTQGYPAAMTVEMIRQIKRPQLCEPTVIYGDDTTKKINYLHNKLFQFKTRLYYDDYEKSVTSPISVIAYPNSCADDDPTKSNNIEVTFETGSEIATKIELFVRILSDTMGDFLSVVVLDKAKLGIASNSTFTYKFYNDVNYLPFDVDRSIQLQDQVPLLSKAQEVIDGNKLVHGNVLEGYDPVDTKVGLALGYDENVSGQTFSIIGRVQIRNPYAKWQRLLRGQPIHDNFGQGTICFGGIDYDPSATIQPQENNVSTQYKQNLPLGGFVFYLAETPYHGVSRQNLGGTGYVFSQNNLNLPILSSATGVQPGVVYNVDKIRLYVPPNGYWSDFQINNIQEGTYILRVASHNTTQAQLDSGSLDYQKTSTYTASVAGVQGHECVIEVKTVAGVQTAKVNGVNYPITNGFVQIQDSIIMDLTDPSNTYSSIVNDGYVVDKDNLTLVGAAIVNDTRIPLSEMDLLINATFRGSYNSLINTYDVIKRWATDKTFADHNGFFYHSFSIDSTLGSVISSIFTTVKTGGDLNALIPGDSFYTEAGGAATFLNQNFSREGFILRNTSAYNPAIDDPLSVQQHGRTQIQGVVYNGSTGLPASNVKVLYTRGNSNVAITDNQGQFSLLAYGDHYDIGVNGYLRNDNLVFMLNGSKCIGVFSQNLVNVTINLPPYNNIGNFVVLLTTPITTVTILSQSQIGLKRGGNYQMGVVYYDHSIRNGLTQTVDYDYKDVNHPFGQKISIPFYTELISGTTQIVGKSKPILGWGIMNQPPIWATHYQLVMQQRSSVGEFRQFIAKQVEYVDEQGVSASFTAATQLRINFENILEPLNGYKNLYPNSLLSYSYTDGDRIRFIRDSGGNLFPNYYDYPINGKKTAAALILYVDKDINIGQLQNGVLFEIYNPKKDNPEKNYWECGQCFEIGDAGLPTRYHKQGHTTGSPSNPIAVIQDQSTAKTRTLTSNHNVASITAVINGTIVTYTNVAGFDTSTPHNFQVGDYIYVNQQIGTPAEYHNYYGYVVQINSATSFVTSTPYTNPLVQGNIYVPATGIFTGGDTYYRVRNMPYLTNPGWNPAAACNAYKQYYIEDASYSDFFYSKYWQQGRPNRVDADYRQTRRQSTIYYSNEFIPETSINDLNNFYELNFETYDVSFGSIQKLNSQDAWLDMFQELKVFKLPINQTQLYDNTGQSVGTVGQTAVVLAKKPVPYTGEFGIGKNPESFSKWGNRRYFLDSKRGVFCRLSNDGIVPVSEYHMHNFFSDKCTQLTSSGSPFHVFSIVDIKFGEVVVCFEDTISQSAQNRLSQANQALAIAIGANDAAAIATATEAYTQALQMLNISGETLAFHDDMVDAPENFWTSFYSFKPEFIMSNGVNIVSFKNGYIYTHNTNSTYNNFYGVQYNSQAWIPINGEPSKEKTFEALSLESENVWEAVVDCPNGQQTNLILTDFEKKLNMQYAALWNDINTPNVAFPLINGDKLQDWACLVKLTNSDTDYRKLYAINMLWITNERSNK